MNTDYRLLDTGSGRRLEQFGGIRIVRTAKQAYWKPALPSSEWDSADAVYDGDEWRGELPEFTARFDDAVFSLGLLETGQIGIFPEQQENWEWLRKTVSDRPLRILNGFAYTGGSTIFSSTPYTDVTHLDASKPALTRARQNLNLSGRGANSVRFIPDDVLTFMAKEAKRGNRYDGFIFDPPAFGRGGSGKTWKLTKDLPKLAGLIKELSDGCPKFVLLTAHDPELDENSLADAVRSISKEIRSVEKGELIMRSESGKTMNSGYFARYAKV